MVPRHLLYLWNRRLKEEGLGTARPWREIPFPPEKMERLSPYPSRRRRKHLSLPLNLLSPKQRDVVELLFYEGLSEAETAKRLHISRRSVRVHKRRALAKLRAHLSQNRHIFTTELSRPQSTVETPKEQGG
ncbi:MAG: sigma-70 family RNA polymerase sigma factor [Candidatus Caldatribacterium sp.]|uniref:RNA polymerase sigma factor n=1 Tax=Candidatus Caldatribacterium sp. TaxID=2282143 RepID=UPI0029972AD3|nr:sigma-70 family RNA polymerase sigma factor [Candidatus Caldatribacterium sp.]MCX7731520.1 sigma-70 family RNA polymerase sigma factor [Candidatus Caldatribacterium sp.]MDW8081045.1 sigma-70 family RNA polymerase sigma factor [Candidatus Calescibacterium sp.]